MRIHSASGAVLMLFLTACAGHDSRTITEPSLSSARPQFELVDETQRIAADEVIARVYGSFVIPGAAGPVTILAGWPTSRATHPVVPAPA
jgi:hypothetical protein